MTDSKAFRAYLMMRGWTLERLAENLGIAACTLSYKVNNKRQFKPTEIVAIKNLLGMTPQERDNIFFAECVEEKSTS